MHLGRPSSRPFHQSHRTFSTLRETLTLGLCKLTAFWRLSVPASPRRALQERLLGRAGSDGRGGALACPLCPTLPEEGRSYNSTPGQTPVFSESNVLFRGDRRLCGWPRRGIGERSITREWSVTHRYHAWNLMTSQSITSSVTCL